MGKIFCSLDLIASQMHGFEVMGLETKYECGHYFLGGCVTLD